MARPREFNIDDALSCAMDVFWTHGYQASSLTELLDAMQIARGSLYKAFKDKHSIYLAALDLYDRTVIQASIDALGDKNSGDGFTRIKIMLMDACEKVTKADDRRGCLLCNAAIDQAPFDSEVQDKVMAMCARYQKAIADALRDASSAEDWSAQKRADIALNIYNSYLGLRVLTKAGYDAKSLETIALGCLRAIECT